jgi:DNA replication and repair protein RecF
MKYLNLRARDYRNIKTADLLFSENLNIFLGENGQGKTNFIESLYLLARGDSFRYGDNSSYINFDTQQAFISCRLDDQTVVHDISALIKSNTKTFELNGKRAASATLAKLFSVVLFSPESLAAIKEGADHRRDLVDDLLLSVDRRNASLIADFRKVLRMRNKILRQYTDQKASRKLTTDLLESINPQFLKLSTELSVKRIAALCAIKDELNRAMREITGKNVEISVEYVISSENKVEESPENIKNSILTRMNELNDAELATGASLVGPQKHDVRFLYNGKDSRFFCSQGQQRALILSFKMAQIVYHSTVHGTYPILMLDDVLSELDSEKRDLLIRFLSKVPTQIFITTTDLSLPESFKGNEVKVFNVCAGLATE